MRFDRDAPAYATGLAALRGVASPWSVLAWAMLLAAIVVSFRPAVPVIWGDTPSFVQSAFLTLSAGRPTVAGGRDPGYPAALAVTFAFGGDLATMVRLQQAAWAVLILALAATAHGTMRNALALVPIILVATYPGLLLFGNVLTSELLFTVFLNLAMAALLLATCAGKSARCCAVAASILCAALAACFRSQGILVPIAAVLVGVSLARPDTPVRLAVIAVSIMAGLALLGAGSRFAATESDEASSVFISKTLFCNHLDIVLASQAARHEIASAAGDRTEATMARLAVDLAAEPARWPVLGFFGDACLFDATLDREIAGGGANAVNAAGAYRRTFLAAVRDRPLSYASKFIRQMAYGASVAWPPYGLEPAIPVSTDDVPHVSGIMMRHGWTKQPIDLQGGPVRIGLLADLPGASAHLYRALSSAFVICTISWMVVALRRRRGSFVMRGGVVILMWAASIVTAAASHTFDVLRYLIPAVPMVGFMLSLCAVELARTLAGLRRKPIRNT